MPPPRSSFIEPCLPSSAERPAERARLGARDQARRLSADGAPRSGRHPAADPQRPRLVAALSADRRGGEPAQGALVPDRRRGGRLRRQRASPCSSGCGASRTGRHVFLFAFDLLELDGEDLRREPIRDPQGDARQLAARSLPGLRINEHLPHPGDVVFRHACKMGLEGIVSKRLGSRYVSGRSTRLAQVQEPGGAGGEARGGRGLGTGEGPR